MNASSIVFNSRDRRFKEPYGALRSGRTLTLRILVDQSLAPKRVCLIIKYDRHQTPACYDMTGMETPEETDNYIEYSVRFPVEDPGLYWYYFQIETPDGTRLVGRTEDNFAEIQEPPCNWQLTVYKQKYLAPEWIYGGAYYHIFVDRFCKGENPTPSQALEKESQKDSSGDATCSIPLSSRILRSDWGGQPQWEPEDGVIYNRDFFGGNLSGIRSKLPYLHDLGITCLYLSPIFEAYSNHKYDTGDYSKIDPMFGSEEDFTALCKEAESMGMRVICDGVFSHTGSDSRYFDKEGHYGGNGAWQNPDSPYRDWYYFHEDGSYDTWWGIETLPRLNKSNPNYLNFICGEDGIVRKWLRAGASGWRLDVADELPPEFLEALVQGAKEEKSDAMILGEVWEDASNKIAYGTRCNYFEGNKLDSVMNYPFRNAIIDFVRYGNAPGLAEIVEQIEENYPSYIINSLMNLVGTHDSIRILTALAGKDLGPDPSREEEAVTKLSPEEWERGIRLLKIAVLLQMTLPGVPCIYYGDEAGTEGYKDPFNRTCFPWGTECQELQEWYRRILKIRRSHTVYRQGRYRTLAANNGFYAFERFDSDSLWYGDIPAEELDSDAQLEAKEQESLITCANCGIREATLCLDENRTDLLTGRTIEENTITVFPGEVLLLAKTEEGR